MDNPSLKVSNPAWTGRCALACEVRGFDLPRASSLVERERERERELGRERERERERSHFGSSRERFKGTEADLSPPCSSLSSLC